MEDLELTMPTVEQMKQRPKDTRLCPYEGCIVTGSFKDMEDHVASTHGAKRLAYHCEHVKCKESGETFRSIAERRAHYKEHGWG